MRRLAITVLIALSFVWFGACRSCVAQQIIGRPMLPLSANGPLSIAGLRYWWISEDLAVDTPVDGWVDRIQGNNAFQLTAASRPTNRLSLGVYFDGSSQYLTVSNAFYWGLPSSGGTGSCFVVFMPSTPSAAFAGMLQTTNSNDYGLLTTSGNQLNYSGQAGNASYATFISGAATDTAIVLTNSTTKTAYFYVSGALISSANDWDPSGQHRLVGRRSTGNYYKGYIREMMWYTNILSTAQVLQLHTYAATKYGY